MRSNIQTGLLLVLLVMLIPVRPGVAANDLLHHDLSVTAEPDQQTIRVQDIVTIPNPGQTQALHFLLHENLSISDPAASNSSETGYRIEKLEGPIPGKLFGMETADLRTEFSVPVTLYRLTPSQSPATDVPTMQVTLTCNGVIHHPIEQLTAEYERSFSTTPGIVGSDGIVLSGSSMWVPWFGENLMTFSLETDLPQPWISVSQGHRTQNAQSTNRSTSRWECPEPMEEVYFIAAPFTETTRQVSGIQVMAFLRGPEPELAARYLDATGQYLDLYTRLIGPYPFKKFALIENFWETGYGMPSFTLLGPTVIRLPFILHSSYPHELLHNWWGNGVYVDYATGNWCEGLTAYLADHLIKEQRGQGAEYRRSTLQKFTDYVNAENDFPLAGFTSRIHSPSEAVGYGKSLMMFHMLRRQLGDHVFALVLQSFYKDFRFRHASFDDIRRTVEAVTVTDWTAFFDQWVNRTGAPELILSGCSLVSAPNTRGDSAPETPGSILEVTLDQLQEGAPFQVQVPLAITLSNTQPVEWRTVSMAEKRQTFRFELPGTPVRVDADPEFDVFRRLHRTEIPPALSQIYGADHITIVLPQAESESRLAAYRKLAEAWAADSPERFSIVMDEASADLPEGAVWLLGALNRHAELMKERMQTFGAVASSDGIAFDGAAMPWADHALVSVIPHPESPDHAVAWLVVDHSESLDGLSRKLPHYGKYSFLVFEGTEPTNVLSAQWAPSGSPMTAYPQSEAEAAALPPATATEPVPMGSLPSRSALGELPAVYNTDRMMDSIRFLTSPELKGRGAGSPGLDAAAEYIARQFETAGLRPGGTCGSWYQEWQEPVSGSDTTVTMKNVIGFLPGKLPELADQPVIVCAHYDHLGADAESGGYFPGADDNASGVAVLCELAAQMRASGDRKLVFIAFAGEETGRSGSKHFVREYSNFDVARTMAVINLDTIGRYDNKHFLVIGAGSAREWRHLFMGCGHATGIATRLVSEPLDSSDQESFIEAGIPAVQIFSGPHRDYHSVRDTIDRINSDGLAKAAALTREALTYLIGRREPLSSSGTDQSPPKMPTGPGRTVGTGSMPDFTFDGTGVRLADVAANSPAAAAGLKAGDVLIRFGGKDVIDLRSYTQLLRSFSPGDSVEVDYIRDGRTLTTTIILGEKTTNEKGTNEEVFSGKATDEKANDEKTYN